MLPFTGELETGSEKKIKPISKYLDQDTRNPGGHSLKVRYGWTYRLMDLRTGPRVEIQRRIYNRKEGIKG